MLVLSRKKNETIIIDDRIKITVIEIRGDKVRLGIEAPRDVPVHRSEVYELLQKTHHPEPGHEASGHEDGAVEPQSNPAP